ncbi:MAG: ribulokinase [Tepidisphaeraceae bacterium]|jgi:L-ribulokinase
MSGRYAIGLDFGTNSMRVLIVDARDGREVASVVADYAGGEAGVVLDSGDPNLARQQPEDYLDAIVRGVSLALKHAAKEREFSPGNVIGIGVDTTGSTPMPVDRQCRSLATLPGFAGNPHAMAWLWKDHTAYAEAEEITATAARHRPEYLKKIGGRYSSEWFWAKTLHCARTQPAVFDAAYTWVEIADWIPAVLTGTTDADKIRRGVCAAGHKAMYNAQWGGYPDEAFVSMLNPGLVRLRRTLPAKCETVAAAAGGLSAQWAGKLNLPAGIPVAVGAFDAHLGAVGAGICEGTMVKIMGTSTCDIMISPLSKPIADVPGLCGIVPGSVLPGYYGLEAGQSAVGDIFNWWVSKIEPGGKESGSHQALTAGAETLRPGASGLLGLDWLNGNRTILVDQRLSGMLLGVTLHTSPAEIYRALIESTAMGARVIMERFEEYGVAVRRVVNCGGIAARNPLVMQIYADVMNRPIAVSRSLQTCALGSAIAACVVAGPERGGYEKFEQAVGAMTGAQPRMFTPNPASVAVYERLYRLYRRLHDAFGVAGHQADLSDVMKELLSIRDRALAK